jgi:hypothetical protein
MNDISARRQMTLPNGSASLIDFEGKGGLLSAVFENGATKKLKIGSAVTVDGAELTISNLYAAREAHTAVPANGQAAPATRDIYYP